MKKTENVAGSFLSLFEAIHDKFTRPGEKITRHRLAPAQFHTLGFLHRRGPLSISELANELKISKQQTSPLICKLIGSGLVAKKVDEHDRRVVFIEITATGRDTIEELWLDVQRVFAEKLQVLSETELDELEQMLQRTREILQNVQ